MKKMTIHPCVPLAETEVYCGHDLLGSNWFKELCNQWGSQLVIVADRSVKDSYGVKLARYLKAALVEIPSGERAKTQGSLELILAELFKMGAGRDTVLIALGGGVTTDLAGFAASIYLRGIPFVSIPTTLLAMVDAAIGGKTGIDTPFGKNLIGTIYHPKAIVADLETLATLPEKEWLNGLAEILKIGLVCNESLWTLAQKNGKDPECILRAMQEKISVIEQDPTEQSLRRVLNFGHTIGHALETISEYTMSHGEAVALGSIVEGYLSVCLGYLPKQEFDAVRAAYSGFDLKLPKGYCRKDFLQAMSHDKKKASGKIRFVLIDRIGHAMAFDGNYCRPVALNELEPALQWMEKEFLHGI